MSEETKPTFTPEQIARRTRGNANSMFFAILCYLKKHDMSLDEFCGFVGQLYAPTWTEGLTAKQIAQGMALNYVSLGAELHSFSGDESQAEVVIGEWRSAETLAFFGLAREEADSVLGIAQPIAEHLGFDYEWSRQGDEITMTFSR